MVDYFEAFAAVLLIVYIFWLPYFVFKVAKKNREKLIKDRSWNSYKVESDIDFKTRIH